MGGPIGNEDISAGNVYFMTTKTMSAGEVPTDTTDADETKPAPSGANASAAF